MSDKNSYNHKTKKYESTTALQDYYEALPPLATSPRADFVRRLMMECKCTETSVRGWIAGTFTPAKWRREIISQVTGIPEETLWKKIDNNNK